MCFLWTSHTNHLAAWHTSTQRPFPGRPASRKSQEPNCGAWHSTLAVVLRCHSSPNARNITARNQNSSEGMPFWRSTSPPDLFIVALVDETEFSSCPNLSGWSRIVSSYLNYKNTMTSDIESRVSFLPAQGTANNHDELILDLTKFRRIPLGPWPGEPGLVSSEGQATHLPWCRRTPKV